MNDPIMKPRHTIPWTAFVLGLVAVIAFALYTRPRTTRTATSPSPAIVASAPSDDSPRHLFPAPEFTFTDRSGRAVAKQDLLGHVWVVDFIFTYCAGPCPVMTQAMADLQARFADASKLRFVSMTVDPERDTLEVLSDYADRYGADKNRWLFLRGEEAAIRRVASKGFFAEARESSKHEREVKGMDEILHSTHFFLVDAEGWVRGTYIGPDPEDMARLVDDIKRLLASGGS